MLEAVVREYWARCQVLHDPSVAFQTRQAQAPHLCHLAETEPRLREFIVHDLHIAIREMGAVAV